MITHETEITIDKAKRFICVVNILTILDQRGSIGDDR